jgi:hypothetical protein
MGLYSSRVTPTWVPSLRLSLNDASWQSVVAAAGGDQCILQTPADLFPAAPLNPFDGGPYATFQYEGDFLAAVASFDLDLRPGALYLGIIASPPLVRVRLAQPGPITYLALPDLTEATVAPLVAALNALVQ